MEGENLGEYLDSGMTFMGYGHGPLTVQCGSQLLAGVHTGLSEAHDKK